MGQRLSGWVGANRQTILNSDPMLDLGEVARALRPPLRSCLSTPLTVGNELVGVLTVYSTHRDAFTEDHKRIAEVIARQVSHTVQHALGFRREQAERLRDQFTGLPNRKHLERFVASELASDAGVPCSVLLLNIGSGSRGSHPTIPERRVGQIADAFRGALRGADLLFRYDADCFVALLPQTDSATADSVGRRLVNELGKLRSPDDDQAWTGTVRLGRATGPEDGNQLSDLVRAAETRLVSPTSLNRPSIH